MRVSLGSCLHNKKYLKIFVTCPVCLGYLPTDIITSEQTAKRYQILIKQTGTKLAVRVI